MFKDRDVVCFLGDSITAGGLYMAEVYQTLRKKYQIKCYNCGVSGGTAKKAVEYLHSLCLRFNPSKVITMFGINDIERWLLEEKHKNFPNRGEILHTAMENYKKSYERIICEIKASGADAVICIPVPYDEESEGAEENLHCQYLLDECGEFLYSLAKKYDCFVVDYRKTMMPLLCKGIISPDRVHPTVRGYHIMAQIFLYEVGEIPNIDTETEFEFEAWNRERFDAEQELHTLKYVEYCDIFEAGWLQNKSLEEKKALARKKFDAIENKTTFVPRAYLDYIEKADIMDRLVGEVVKKTIF